MMAKHKILRGRINKVAKELDEFGTHKICQILNCYPNNEGRLYARRRRVTMSRLQNLLLANKNIIKLPSEEKLVTWKWIGEEE